MQMLSNTIRWQKKIGLDALLKILKWYGKSILILCLQSMQFRSDMESGLQKARVESISIAVLNAVMSSGTLQTSIAQIVEQSWVQRGKKNDIR